MYINNCTNTISCFYEVEPNIYGQCKVKMFPYKIIGRNVKSEIMLSPKMAPHLHLTSVCVSQELLIGLHLPLSIIGTVKSNLKICAIRAILHIRL